MARDRNDKTTGDLYSDDRSVLSAGAALAAMRKLHKKECVVCGSRFEGIKQKATCSDRCRKTKSRLEKKETERVV